VSRASVVRATAILTGVALILTLACGRERVGVRVVRDLPYYEGPGFDAVKHRLDLYVPTGRGPYPVLIFVHGGSWQMGDNVGFFRIYHAMARRLAGRGVVVAVPSYRLAPHVKHPGQAWDVARAVGWVHRHVHDYGGDPGRLFLVGHSAGAQLVALVTLDPRYFAAQRIPADAVAGVVGLSGPYDLVYAWKESDWRGRALNLKPAFGEDPAVLAAASPVNHVGKRPPPFLLLYAQHEQDGFGVMARALAAKLRGAGGTASYAMLKGKTHITEVSALGRPGDRATELILTFVNNVGRTPRAGSRSPAAKTPNAGLRRRVAGSPLASPGR
jgi:acetyl esterase/lipase